MFVFSETATKKMEVDEEFVINEDLEEDDEQTLEEEEKLAGKEDHDKEIAALEKEGCLFSHINVSHCFIIWFADMLDIIFQLPSSFWTVPVVF